MCSVQRADVRYGGGILYAGLFNLRYRLEDPFDRNASMDAIDLQVSDNSVTLVFSGCLSVYLSCLYPPEYVYIICF